MSICITGSGSYIPEIIKKNKDFLENTFLNSDGSNFKVSNEVIIKKFQAITGIEERRYAKENLKSSDLASFAAKDAIKNSKIDIETLDYIIVAHNFGDVKYNTKEFDQLPSLAARVKYNLKINNPDCVSYDLIFGCPGWIEGVIQAQAFIKAGMAKKCLVIGAETLSRTVDTSDRDSMIFSDGAGATIIEKKDDNLNQGILSHKSCTFSTENTFDLFLGDSFNPNKKSKDRYIKMHGHKIYEFAITKVPQALKECLEASGKSISDVKKIFLHQANEKMDDSMVERFYKLYDLPKPENVMPMSISKLGNSSVATIPTLYDLVKNNKIKNHSLNKGDIILFGSVGAGMNVNAITYQV
tara:strand:+ start:133 stop:1197 length:1065 start_codon:yes stop_codon:yes gene_type:complete